MGGLPSQNHVVSVVLEEQDSYKEHAGPVQEEHGLQGGHSGQSSDDGGEDGGGDGGIWNHRLTKGQGRKSLSWHCLHCYSLTAAIQLADQLGRSTQDSVELPD